MCLLAAHFIVLTCMTSFLSSTKYVLLPTSLSLHLSVAYNFDSCPQQVAMLHSYTLFPSYHHS